MNISHIGFIGFGLIGGSIAKALKESYPNCHIVAASRSIEPLLKAKEENVIDVVSEGVTDIFSACDIIFICTPVITITKYMEQLKPVIKSNCIITDVGSVKGIVHRAAAKLDMEQYFIGGHPMAGSELSGYAHSYAGLLDNAIYVITTSEKTSQEHLDAYIQLVKDIKAVPIVMDYETHDYSAAAISHLPHLISAALTKLVKDSDCYEGYMHLLAAGGFKDTTRIAASSPEMWEQICASNSAAIISLLADYIGLLTEIKEQLNRGNYTYVNELFNEAGKYRNTF